MNYDVAVIGGGASGLACAVRLTEISKLKIAVIDAGERLGKKLSATGNGQGNISNINLSPEHYFGGGAYLAGKIACNDPYACERLFDCILTADEKGRIYPAGRQASSLCDCLIRKLKGKAEIIQGVKVINIERGFKITLSDGTTCSSRFIAFCVGGKAQKQYKTDGSSYALVSKFGHSVTNLFPSLVQVKTQTKYIKTLKGIRADCNASAVVGGKNIKTVRGDVIFTDYGISGNAVFSLSPYITDKPDAVISLEFLPDVSADDISRNFERRKEAGCPVSELLSGSLHNQLGRAVVTRAVTEDKIVHTLKNFTLPVVGTLGFDYAQVTRGGIEMRGIKDNLESAFIDNLFFAGEVLDVDGDCGGYNLQWAFTSGMAVADGIINKYDQTIR